MFPSLPSSRIRTAKYHRVSPPFGSEISCSTWYQANHDLKYRKTNIGITIAAQTWVTRDGIVSDVGGASICSTGRISASTQQELDAELETALYRKPWVIQFVVDCARMVTLSECDRWITKARRLVDLLSY